MSAREPEPDARPSPRGLLDEQVTYYRARAPEYDATSTPEGDPFAAQAEAIRDDLQALEPWGRVLEIAAGTGQWTELLAERADELVVTDASPEMLDQARSRVGDRPGMRYAVTDAFSLEPSHAFDTVSFGFLPVARASDPVRGVLERPGGHPRAGRTGHLR